MEHFTTDCESFINSSFRFGPSIAHLANVVLARLEEPRRIIGAGVNNQRSLKGPYQAIISRTNSSLISALIQKLQTGERPYLEGGTDDLKRLLDGVQQLQRGQPSQVPEFFGFRSWKQLVDCSNTEQGREFRTIVKLVNVYGLTSLFKAVSGAEVSLQNATVVLSTTHKAKGGEWDSVVLADDFKIPSRNLAGDELFTAREELRINYVAFTRARLELTLPDNLRSWLSS